MAKSTWPFVKYSAWRSSPRTPLKYCPCTLFVLIAKQTSAGIWTLLNPGMGRKLSPAWHVIKGSMNRFAFLLPIKTRKKRSYCPLNTLCIVSHLDCPSVVASSARALLFGPDSMNGDDQGATQLRVSSCEVQLDTIASFLRSYIERQHSNKPLKYPK